MSVAGFCARTPASSLLRPTHLRFVTKHNTEAKRTRGRPLSPWGAYLRELGISRLQAWKWGRLAEIPEPQFEALLAKYHTEGKMPTTDGILRAFGKLSPDSPRPSERARTEAIEQLELAAQQLELLVRELLETGSDSELAHAQTAATAVTGALQTLADQNTIRQKEKPNGTNSRN